MRTLKGTGKPSRLCAWSRPRPSWAHTWTRSRSCRPMSEMGGSTVLHLWLARMTFAGLCPRTRPCTQYPLRAAAQLSGALRAPSELLQAGHFAASGLPVPRVGTSLAGSALRTPRTRHTTVEPTIWTRERTAGRTRTHARRSAKSPPERRRPAHSSVLPPSRAKHATVGASLLCLTLPTPGRGGRRLVNWAACSTTP